ncbi:hypothetical protein V6N12_029980, partial [Hibiscus sabdariffa]
MCLAEAEILIEWRGVGRVEVVTRGNNFCGFVFGYQTMELGDVSECRGEVIDIFADVELTPTTPRTNTN